MVARVERVLRETARRTAPFWVDVPAFSAFAEEIAETMQRGELTFVSRQHLLRRAAHHGLRRFDANLIIAMVQHRGGENSLISGDASRRSWIFPLTIAATVQIVIALALFVLIHG